MLEEFSSLFAGADLTSKAGLAALALVILSWISGKGLIMVIGKPWARKAFAAGLKTADIPGVVVGKWFQAGPLHVLSGSVIAVLVFVGFWFFSFMDKLLSFQKADTVKLVEALEKILGEAGSTDRKLYIQAKTLPDATAAHVSAIAANLRDHPTPGRR